jgi:YggT family protein
MTSVMSGVDLISWTVGPLLGVMTFLFIFRIILTWYPQVSLKQLPFSLIAWPTEPFLVLLRKIVPPLGGVDITPIIWVGIFSLVREFLLGQQGLLTMVARLNG